MKNHYVIHYTIFYGEDKITAVTTVSTSEQGNSEHAVDMLIASIRKIEAKSADTIKIHKVKEISEIDYKKLIEIVH